MKALLFLYLLASISCFNLLNAGLCIFGNEKIISLAGNIISSVKDKDFGNVINLLLSNFSELKNIVANCLESEKNLIFKLLRSLKELLLQEILILLLNK